MEVANRLRQAFEAAGIPPERWGNARAARLTAGEREAYFSILRSFAGGETPSLRPELGPVLEALAREDLVHHDRSSGEILVAYPFSGQPTAHRVRLDTERDVYAMCAIDALGIPFMLDVLAEVFSSDSLTGEEVWVRVEPGEGAWWEPEDAVVLAGGTGGSGPSAWTCCRFVNSFASGENAERYLGGQEALRGEVLPIPQAVEAGRFIFGELLYETR